MIKESQAIFQVSKILKERKPRIFQENIKQFEYTLIPVKCAKTILEKYLKKEIQILLAAVNVTHLLQYHKIKHFFQNINMLNTYKFLCLAGIMAIKSV